LEEESNYLKMEKILIISPEIYPKIKVGGLGKMVAGVAEELKKKGAEIKVVSPQKEIYFPLFQKKTEFSYRRLGVEGAELCLTSNWQPDWLWIHDWGGVWAAESFLRKLGTNKAKVLWTIHSPVGENYGYEYSYGQPGEGDLINWGDSFFDFAGLVEKGIKMSHRITTVSPSFSRSLSRHKLFAGAKSIIGIANGVDAEEWNPRTDRLIDLKLKNSWLEFKKKNKQILQQKFALPEKEVPVFAFVSRIVPQKGMELLLKVLPKFVGQNDLQFVFVGAGQKNLVQKIFRLGQRFPDKIGLKLVADFDLPHQVFAGADFLVLPSVSEPFGIVVAEARKYGVIPIVHLVDGLKDQVKDGQNGFGFQKYQKEKLEEKLYQALGSWQSEWQKKRLGDWAGIESWQKVTRKWLEVFSEC